MSVYLVPVYLVSVYLVSVYLADAPQIRALIFLVPSQK